MKTIHNGIQTVRLKSWRAYYSFINNRLQNPHTYVFRGLKDSIWKLETTLDRAAARVTASVNPTRHVEQFRLSARGRRGMHPKSLSEEEWWALGQHYGLWTPLLDWTESPYVALYFAFIEKNEKNNGNRAVYALSRDHVFAKSTAISHKHASSPSRPNIVEFITPESDENARLVNQSGLFTRCTLGIDIATWVRRNFRGETHKAVLVKLLIPERDKDRLDVLRALNRMNINHLSLFPDVGGSAEYCNQRLAIPGY